MSIEQHEPLKPSIEREVRQSASLALAQDTLSSTEMTGRHGHGGFYPYPYPMPHYEPPVSRISVSPPGHVVPSVELVMSANKDAAAPEEVGRHNHGGCYPYQQPEFHKPVSRIEVSPPGHVVPGLELVMGANRDANNDMIQAAAKELVGHHHNPAIPYPYPYLMPHYEPPVVRLSVSPPGIVRPTQIL